MVVALIVPTLPMVTLGSRVVPIPIPVLEIAPILPKMLASVSATIGVQAPIRYHIIYSISNLIGVMRNILPHSAKQVSSHPVPVRCTVLTLFYLLIRTTRPSPGGVSW